MLEGHDEYFILLNLKVLSLMRTERACIKVTAKHSSQSKVLVLYSYQFSPGKGAYFKLSVTYTVLEASRGQRKTRASFFFQWSLGNSLEKKRGSDATDTR